MFSIILTIHNKDFLINSVLDSIKKHTVGSYELNIVLDGCSDNSENLVDSFIKNNTNIKINKFIADNVFETKANNIGLKNSTEKYCIIVQDDMVINERDWNNRLLKPILSFSDIFAVTAKNAHNWVFNPNSKHQFLKEDLDYCWCDILIPTNIVGKENMDRKTFIIRDSVNRGPLLIKHDVLQQVNYLDEDFAPQDMDDHDLCYRVYKRTGLKAGCYLIDFVSDINWGGTRKNGQPASWLLKSHHKNSKIVWNRHKDLIIGVKHDEERNLV